MKKAKKTITKVIPYEQRNKRIRVTDDSMEFEFENTSENINKALQRVSGVSDRQAVYAIIANVGE